MGPQYYYDSPRSRFNWLERLAPLKEPPLAYLVALIGIILGIYLSTSSNPSLRQFGVRILILLIAFPIHELAHALIADRLGDLTPRYNGRITLNPLAQLNFIGSFLMLFIGLGWASVPINPGALRPNPRVGHMFVAVAGPIANLCLAILCAILWYSLNPILRTFDNPELLNDTFNLLGQFALINMALLFLNLIPITPLDGFYVLKGLLPYHLAYRLEALQRYGFLIFMLVFFVAPLLRIPILSFLIFGPATFVTRLLFGL